MSTEMATFFVVVLLALGMTFFAVRLDKSRLELSQVQARNGLTGGQRKTLSYVQTLLGNYLTAHQSSPLTEIEIEEILRLCKAEINKVLET